MNILLNGLEKDVAKDSNLLDLVDEMNNVLPKLFVIELNGEIIYKENYQTTRLTENDSIEVVVFAGGG